MDENNIKPATAPTLADLDSIQGRLSRKPYDKPTLTTQEIPAGMAQLTMDRATYAAIKTGQDATTPLHSELAPDASVTASKELSERFHAADSEATRKETAGEEVEGFRDALSAPSTKVEICRTKTRLLKCLDYITSFADVLVVYAPTEELAKNNPLQTLSVVRVYDDKQALVSINPEQQHSTFNAGVYQFPSNLMEALLEGLAVLGFAYMITKQEGVLLCVRSFDPEAAAKNPELLERKPLTKLSLVPQSLVDDFDESK